MDRGLRPHQIGGLVFNAVFGVGILTAARSASDVAGTGAWLSILLAGFLSAGAAWFAGRVASLWPGVGLVDGVASLWGPLVARVLGLAYALYLLGLASVVLRIFGEFAGWFLLPQTPLPVILGTMAAVVAYGARLRVADFAGVSDVLVWLGLVPAALLLLSAQFGADTVELLPLFSAGWQGLLAGLGEGVFSYLGFEVILFYAAYAGDPPSLGRWAAAGVLAAAFFYTGAVLVSLGHFSPAFVAQQTWPLFNAAGAVEVPLRFIEQPELLVAALWLFAAFSTMLVAFFAGQLALVTALGLRSRPILPFALIMPVYALSLVPADLQSAEEWVGLWSQLGLILAVGVPLLLWATARLRRGWQGPEGRLR